MTRCGLCHRPVKDREAWLVLLVKRPTQPVRRARLCPRCAKELARGWRR